MAVERSKNPGVAPTPPERTYIIHEHSLSYDSQCGFLAIFIHISMSCSSNIFVFWFQVYSYQKTKISAVKFVEFSKKCTSSIVTSKKIRQEMDFLENSTNLMADILVVW